MLCELSPTTRLELAYMAYDRWSKAFDALKYTKTQTWEMNRQVCPKAEFPSCLALWIQTAQKELDKTTYIKDEICKYSPLVSKENES